MSDLRDELAAVQNCVLDGERELAELRSILDSVSYENHALRSALDPAMRSGADPQVGQALVPFRTLLATARSRAGEAETVVARNPSLSGRGRRSVRPSSLHTSQGSPWTA